MQVTAAHAALWGPGAAGGVWLPPFGGSVTGGRADTVLAAAFPASSPSAPAAPGMGMGGWPGPALSCCPLSLGGVQGVHPDLISGPWLPPASFKGFLACCLSGP